MPRRASYHGRRAMARARAARVRLVPRPERAAAIALRSRDRSLSRRPSRRSAQQEPGGRVDVVVSPRAVRDALHRSNSRDAASDRTTVAVMSGYETLLHRHPTNPILRASDWPYPAHTVFNAGATRLRDGTTLLLCRVEDRRGHSHLCAARSINGIDGWVIDEKPTLLPDIERFPEELWGIEDPRITYVDELGKYAIAYTAYSKGGPGVALALTEDFRSFERYGLVMQPDDKDAALLPHRIDGSFALLHRPIADSGAHIWISYSPDLHNWGGHKLVLQARRGSWWDANKVGLSPPLIETDRGWLMIYHGVRH